MINEASPFRSAFRENRASLLIIYLLQSVSVMRAEKVASVFHLINPHVCKKVASSRGSDNEVINLYLLGVTVRHTSWKCVFESPLSTRSRLVSRKMAARNTSSHKKLFQSIGLSPARASQVLAVAPACIPKLLTRDPGLKDSIF